MPATPRMTRDPSPTISPPTSAASSASVRVIMDAFLALGPGGGAGVELLDHQAGEVHGTVRVDDEAARRIQHQFEPPLARDLLDRSTDLGHDLAGGSFVLLRRPAAGPPDILDELLVFAGAPLQGLFLLLTLEGGTDRTLVAPPVPD